MNEVDPTRSSDNDKLKEMERLNEEYIELSKKEATILQELRHLQQDEILLRNALQDMSETAREKMEKKKRQREEDIVKNLQEALMRNDSSSSSEDDEMDDLLNPKSHVQM
jgi:hypothetical protein